ncbi:MAG: hypothetical protein U0796_19080 [Gemmatales bacterium]
MPDLGMLSRPMRRILAEWIGKLADRLLHFQSQLRFGFIRMLSTTVAETIEDQFHRTRNNEDHQDTYEPEYLDDDNYPDREYYRPRPAPQLESRPQPEPPPQPTVTTQTEGWLGILSHATHILMKWVRGPWAEPILASAVTLVSLLLLIR